VSRDFKPSKQSLSPVGNTVQTLRYLRKAADAVEKQVVAADDAPPWVQAKVREAALSLGMAVSYLQQNKKKERS
jgi:hypothetical protein